MNGFMVCVFGDDDPTLLRVQRHQTIQKFAIHTIYLDRRTNPTRSIDDYMIGEITTAFIAASPITSCLELLLIFLKQIGRDCLESGFKHFSNI